MESIHPTYLQIIDNAVEFAEVFDCSNCGCPSTSMEQKALAGYCALCYDCD